MKDFYDIAADIRSLVHSLGARILTEWNYSVGTQNRHYYGPEHNNGLILGGYQFGVRTNGYKGHVTIYFLKNETYVINLGEDYFEKFTKDNVLSGLNYHLGGGKPIG